MPDNSTASSFRAGTCKSRGAKSGHQIVFDHKSQFFLDLGNKNSAYVRQLTHKEFRPQCLTHNKAPDESDMSLRVSSSLVVSLQS
ncbi:hypothetical protein TNCV_3734631 [Trichonephila clavipes]|nr:hypothetical protein TNCV_3734631 [Trichonephila clavipes]